MNSTAKQIASMLKQNTGSHFLDSGGAYGRHWEENQKRDFATEPATTLRVEEYGIEITHNVYHWLKDQVNYSVAWTAKFNRFAKRPENNDRGWLALMEEFAEKHGGPERYTVNTYNGESSLLSQVIQYVGFETDGEYVYLIQIHNGCDVRGGYTAPKAFTGDDYALGRHADASIWCMRDCNQLTLTGEPDEQHYWTTDDANNFYYQGAGRYGAGKQLDEYERKEISDRHDWIQGTLCYFEDGQALCPKCGSDLRAGF